jgi:hypothetical protein
MLISSLLFSELECLGLDLAAATNANEVTVS